MLLFSRHSSDERLVGTHVVKEEISKLVLYFFFSFSFHAESMPSVCHHVFSPHSCSFPLLLLSVNFCLNLGCEDASFSLTGSKSLLNPRGYFSIIALTMTAGSVLLRKITAPLAPPANMQSSNCGTLDGEWSDPASTTVNTLNKTHGLKHLGFPLMFGTDFRSNPSFLWFKVFELASVHVLLTKLRVLHVYVQNFKHFQKGF